MYYIITNGHNGNYEVFQPHEDATTYSEPDLAALIAECLPTKDSPVTNARFAYYNTQYTGNSVPKTALRLSDERVAGLEREIELYLYAKSSQMPIEELRERKKADAISAEYPVAPLLEREKPYE